MHQQDQKDATMNTTHLPTGSEPNGGLTHDGAKDSRAGIWFNGRQYCFREYRYDQLTDARRYAAIVRLRPELRVPAAVLLHSPLKDPTPGELVTMLQLGIRFDGHHYRVGSYRYDRFLEAAQYVLNHGMPMPAAVPAESRATAELSHIDRLLDDSLDSTFPASDPVSSLSLTRVSLPA